MYVLDTDVVSELRKIPAGRADKVFAAWAADVSLDVCYLSVVTIHELEYGILLVEKRDPSQGAILRRWMTDYVETIFAERLLPFTKEAAKRAAAYQAAGSTPVRDSFIAATADVVGMSMVTRNVKDFGRQLGHRVINPWAPAT
ncbi:MAG: type II toxin-antitoxin system VapC family toxin [Propionibacteriaceae bacterium]|jgi:predicted nucleic acid-binding protein|nr:type II toxin-antitoxin system VapC family toxin [Propionibacteriaceae bacterium]